MCNTEQWAAHAALIATDIEDLARFNDAIDQAVAESVAHYTATTNNFRNLFLGVLGHDLRNLLGAIHGRAMDGAIGREGLRKQAKVVAALINSTDRATQILDDVLDLARSSFGTDYRFRSLVPIWPS